MVAVVAALAVVIAQAPRPATNVRITTPGALPGNYTAASCNRTDVNAVINGPTHTAVDGDIITIPAGNCTWSSTITVPAGIGITIRGSGTPNTTPATFGASASCASGTVITTSTVAFNMSPQFGDPLSRLSCFRLVPSGNPGAVIRIRGACTTSGCPNFRMDNLTMGAEWGNNSWSDQSLTLITNVFGVADHDSIGQGTPPSNYLDFVNIGHGRWQGVGGYGDNSWASPDTFGTNQQFYIENGLFSDTILTDSDETNSESGGGRVTCRFNSLPRLDGFGLCTGHGTDTTYRLRGLRQVENYYNTAVCNESSIGCGSLTSGRSAVGLSFSNTVTNANGGFFKGVSNYDAQRVWRGNNPFGYCDGSNVWDVNSGGAAVVCMDQANRGMGLLVTGIDNNPANGTTVRLASTGSPGSVQQVRDPSYEADTNGPASMDHTLTGGQGLFFANRDFFDETPHQAAQTSATSPFNGSTGTGHGTLARRPTSCTLNSDTTAPGVGYWATDQGTWNQGGPGGVLYVCRDAAHRVNANGVNVSASCTQAQDANHFWCPHYTPYTYPHPLIQ
jgi:hypothetical protein